MAPRRRGRPPSRALLPFGLAALLAFAAPTAAIITFAVMGALAIALLATVFAVGMALGPFLVVIALVALVLRRRRPRRMHWHY